MEAAGPVGGDSGEGCSPDARRVPRGKRSEDKSEHGSTSPPSACSKLPYENECVETSAGAKFRSKGTSCRRGREGGVGGDGDSLGRTGSCA